MRVLAPGAEVYFVIANYFRLMTQARTDCVLHAGNRKKNFVG